MAALSFEQSGAGEAAVGPLPLAAVQQLCCDCGFVKPGADASKPLAQRADTATFFKVLGVNSVSAFRALFYAQRVPAPRPGQAPPPPAPRKSLLAAKTGAPAVRCGPRASVMRARARPRARAERGSAFSARAQEARQEAAAKSYDVPDVSQFASLAAAFESLKWRIIPRPGGATMKPDDYYALYGAPKSWLIFVRCNALTRVVAMAARCAPPAPCPPAPAAKQQAEAGDNVAEKPMWAETGGLDFDGRERWEAWARLKGSSKAEAQRAFCEAYGRALSREADNFRRF